MLQTIADWRPSYLLRRLNERTIAKPLTEGENSADLKVDRYRNAGGNDGNCADSTPLSNISRFARSDLPCGDHVRIRRGLEALERLHNASQNDTLVAASFLGLDQSCSGQLVEEEINRGNPAISGDDEIRSRVCRRIARAARYPWYPPAIAQFLGFGN